MSLETSASPAPTAGTEAGAPSPAASTSTPAPSAPAAPAERTYSRAEVEAETNRVVQDRLAREKRNYDRQMADLRKQYERPATQAEPVDPAEAQLTALMRKEMESYTAPIRQQMTEASLDRAISDLGKRIPEFTDDAKVREILEIVVDQGLDRATHLSIPGVLDLAYRYWKVDHTPVPAPVDVEGIKKQAADQAVKEYLAKKTATTATTPRPEAAGGGTPATSDARAARRTKKGAFDAALEHVLKSRATAE